MKEPLYILGLPGKVGGASTRLRDLAYLLPEDFAITFVHGPDEIPNPEIMRPLETLGVQHVMLDAFDPVPGTWLFVCCQSDYFSSGRAEIMKRRGLRVIWANDMMTEFAGEREGVARGLIDKVFFVSEFHRQAMGPLYPGLPWAMVGNYVCPEFFPFREPRAGPLHIGRLSRHDRRKYPEDFPAFYENISPPETQFWVMAWDEDLAHKYRWHPFDERWHFFPPGQMEAAAFLAQLDLFVYSLGPLFRESWGRVAVEAMLTGVPPLLPSGHFFEQLIVHEDTGFICRHAQQYADYIRQLTQNPSLRARVARKARHHAETTLCNRAAHRALWREALAF